MRAATLELAPVNCALPQPPTGLARLFSGRPSIGRRAALFVNYMPAGVAEPGYPPKAIVSRIATTPRVARAALSILAVAEAD
jgi:hypothetical protein